MEADWAASQGIASQKPLAMTVLAEKYLFKVQLMSTKIEKFFPDRLFLFIIGESRETSYSFGGVYKRSLTAHPEQAGHCARPGR